MKLRLRLLIAAFIVSFLFVAGLSFVSITRFTSLADQNEEVDNSFRVVQQLGQLMALLKDMDIREQSCLLTRSDADYRDFINTRHYTDTLIAGIVPLLKSDKDRLNQLRLLRATILLRHDEGKDNLLHADSLTGGAYTPYRQRVQRLSDTCMMYIRRMQAAEERNLTHASAQRNNEQQTTSVSVKYLSVLFGMLMLTLFFLLLQELRRRGRYQEALQEKINELQRSHSELEQIAYAASHDLQEPLRKIRIFTDRLQHLHRSELDGERIDTLGLIGQYANRMQELVSDLMNLTSLVNNDEPLQRISLREPLRKTMESLQDRIEEKKAVVHAEALPVITGYPYQLYILFRSLLDNALKFTRNGTPPEVTISYSLAPPGELNGLGVQGSDEGFHCISVADNGIGFDNKFADKIFHIFQRLHGQDAGYTGKGIGLAICQRIMVNHKGIIVAYGHPNSGATFKLYFPVKPVGS